MFRMFRMSQGVVELEGCSCKEWALWPRILTKQLAYSNLQNGTAASLRTNPRLELQRRVSEGPDRIHEGRPPRYVTCN